MKLFIAGLIMAVATLGAHAQERIKMDCEEYVALGGRNMPCQAIPTVQVTQEQYDALMAAKTIKSCKEGVLAKFGDDPSCKAKRDVFSTRTSLEGRDEATFTCAEALLACEPAVESGVETKRVRRLHD